MKKLLTIIFFLACLSFTTFGQAPDGLTCENAIPVDTSFSGTIDAPGTYYYTAETYDLPLTCYFYPEEDNISTLYMDIDFTCTPGVYDDPNIAELVDATYGWGVKMPIRFDDFDKGTDEAGRVFYSLTVPIFYREQMAEFGIAYNVPAIVKVVVDGAGTVSLKPDTIFRSCVENSIWLDMPDTMSVGPAHADDVYVLPLTDWQNDSIQFRWTGTTAPAQIWLGTDCAFELNLDGKENSAVFSFSIIPDQGNGENIVSLSKEDIFTIMSTYGNGGVYYMRVVSSEEADMILELKPIEGPMADAIPLTMNETTPIKANDTEQVYYFSVIWERYDMTFDFDNDAQVTAYFAKDVTFDADKNDPNVTAVYSFQDRLDLSVTEVKRLCSAVEGDHAFVKFVTDKDTKVTPKRWDASVCASKSTEIYVDSEAAVRARNSTASFRINYNQWSLSDIKLYWNSLGTMKMYLADTCAGFTLSASNAHVLKYNQFTVKSNGTTDTLTITQDEWKSWADRVDADGYLYFRFNANAAGTLEVTRGVSVVEPDPIPETFVVDTVCFGETYTWNNNTYNQSGTYSVTLTSADGRDSVVTLTLTVLPEVPVTKEQATICFGESYTWQGTTYTTSGEYSVTLQDIHGCDSVVMLNLTVLPEVPVTEEQATVCFGESYTWQGTTYTTSGEYSVTLQDIHGCDSVVTLTLTVLPEVAPVIETRTINFGETYTWNGKEYSESGEYTITLQDENGCDYIHTLILTVLEPENPCVSISTKLTAGETLTINLNSAFNVYCIKYEDWKEAGMTLTWTGAEPLHTFVAETCEFALAPYNKYVHAYVPVHAEEDMVVDMEALAEYVDDAGYLYIRFLTEFEGELTIK